MFKGHKVLQNKGRLPAPGYLEGVSVHGVGGDVAVQDGLLLHLGPSPDNSSLEESAVILDVLLGDGEGSHCGHDETGEVW